MRCLICVVAKRSVVATHILVRASSRVRPWTRVHSFFLHAQYLYYAFSLKSAFRHLPQPPFLHTSPNSGQSSFPLLHLSGLVHLPSANKKGGVAFLTANYAHNKSIEQSHYLSVRASTDGRASCLAHAQCLLLCSVVCTEENHTTFFIP